MPTSRQRHSLILLVLIALSSSRCGRATPVPQDAGLALSEERFEMRVDVNSSSELGGSGELVFRVVPKGGWHIALEAPSEIVLESGRASFDPPLLGDAERTASEDLLQFVGRYQGADGAREDVEGKARFGICRDNGESCSIIRRDFEFSLEARADEGGESS